MVHMCGHLYLFATKEGNAGKEPVEKVRSLGTAAFAEWGETWWSLHISLYLTLYISQYTTRLSFIGGDEFSFGNGHFTTCCHVIGKGLYKGA